MSTTGSSQWPQWGGPNRNFTSEVKGLAPSWPASGPAKLWSRPLGEGYSGIAADGGLLFTLYRKDTQEIVVALNASSGKTVWEFSYPAPFLNGMDMQNGPGPHSTPLVVGQRVYAVGVTGKLHCFDAKTGKVLWQHDLIKEFNGTVLVRGFSASPIAYKATVILPVGGKGHAVIAFNQQDGRVVWSKQDADNSNSSPILVDVNGHPQLILFLAKEVTGLNPATGELLWSYPHETQWNLNISTPLWGEDNLLFCSSGYNGGSRTLQITESAGRSSVKEVWANPRFRINFSNAIRIGEYVYGSSGDFGASFFTAVNIKTGKIAWQHRGLPRSSMLYADGKLIILDEDGNLSLASVSTQGLQIQAKTHLLQNNAWTVPSLVGTKLFARDRKNIMAVEFGH